MKKGLMIALGLVVGLAFFGGSNAYAGSCGSGSSCTFQLMVANVSNIGPIDIQVVWDNTGSTTKFSVQWLSGGPGTPGFIDKFGFNTTATVTQVTYNGNDVTSLWSGLNTGPGNEDGFGSFASTENGGPTAQGSREGISAPIVFTLSSLITTIPDTSVGTEFAVHIGGYPTGCSAFVGQTGSTVSQSPDANCGSTSTPEPITLLLLGPGLLFVGIAGRKISGLKQKDS